MSGNRRGFRSYKKVGVRDGCFFGCAPDGSAEVEAMDLAERPQVLAQRGPNTFLRLLRRDRARGIVEIGGEVRPFDHLREEPGPGSRHHLVAGVPPAPQCQPPAVAQLMRKLV